jgi:hypothetical protein
VRWEAICGACLVVTVGDYYLREKADRHCPVQFSPQISTESTWQTLVAMPSESQQGLGLLWTGAEQGDHELVLQLLERGALSTEITDEVRTLAFPVRLPSPLASEALHRCWAVLLLESSFEGCA